MTDGELRLDPRLKINGGIIYGKLEREREREIARETVGRKLPAPAQTEETRLERGTIVMWLRCAEASVLKMINMKEVQAVSSQSLSPLAIFT